ncbi:MAG: hypothetical protein JST00_28065 [Deltaproteobacteria bacterium]|nr:hypothetical protein [Deltaproteobacteria bacterium]
MMTLNAGPASVSGALRRASSWASALVVLSTSGCAAIAISTAPSRNAVVSADARVTDAHRTFRQTLAEGDYEKLGSAIEKLSGAYLLEPNEPQINLDLGMAHLWRVAERERMTPIPPTIIDDLAVADFYLGQALLLAPDDARITGFQASTRMAMGSVHHDERQKRIGYFQMKDAVAAYPEFNLFVRSSVMSQLPSGDPGLEEAESALWEDLGACLDFSVDRTQPDIERIANAGRAMLAKGAPTTRRERACLDSSFAPHNFEGFFWQFGDVLTKRGKPALAKKVYAIARVAPSFEQWSLRDTFEATSARADERAAAFARASRAEEEPELYARSKYFCVSCHAK